MTGTVQVFRETSSGEYCARKTDLDRACRELHGKGIDEVLQEAIGVKDVSFIPNENGMIFMGKEAFLALVKVSPSRDCGPGRQDRKGISNVYCK